MMIILVSLLLGIYTAGTGVLSLSLDGVSTHSTHPAGEPLTLNCDYSYSESESSELVVTWYFNGSPIPIYQWVPSIDNGPQVIHEMFKDNLDLTHQADQDMFKKHSALHIINPDINFAGNYRCRVSTFTKEVTLSKDISIYVAPSSIFLTYTNGFIKCLVEGVYPIPSLIMSWTCNNTVFSAKNVEIVSNNIDNHLYDASISTTVEEDSIAPHDVMTCDVVIADGAYEDRVEKKLITKKEIPEDKQKVILEEEICNSADCQRTKESVPVLYPIDHELLDRTVPVGLGLETFSEEAARFSQSGCSTLNVNIVVFFVLSLYYSS